MHVVGSSFPSADLVDPRQVDLALRLDVEDPRSVIRQGGVVDVLEKGKDFGLLSGRTVRRLLPYFLFEPSVEHVGHKMVAVAVDFLLSRREARGGIQVLGKKYQRLFGRTWNADCLCSSEITCACSEGVSSRCLHLPPLG